ncbi:capsular polysaccharide synthesis protein [Weissella cibaria]|uniref:capsular polysaccharide synthesis protein n=1 Tax=Weissella cibaria TaxID=137591 RepID=UPI000FFE2AD0|nr:capsular polysaccharide synthesis protein [Weissella cibaria]MBZ6069143.1 capsular polysaccharide synthesis protein [Weissella cibaria]QAT26274.1 hypothetical protein EQZ96_09875 [Weissella cibaria]HJF37981.1 capsular polysaccharide synthesis protein [Weissella cibaria]
MDRMKIRAGMLPFFNYGRKAAFKLTKKQVFNEVYYDWIRRTLKKNVGVDPLKYESLVSVNSQKNWKVWVMWWQGENQAPEIVKANIKRLRNVFGDRNVILITKENYKEYVHLTEKITYKFFKNEISITHMSDIIRFNLLRNYGGLWIDATVAVSCKYQSPENLDFITLVPSGDGYASFIGNGKWTGWFIGGPANYPFFQYMVDFFNEYWEKHDVLFDYYLVDDAISVFSDSRRDFQLIQKNLEFNGDYYYLINKLNDHNENLESIEHWKNDEGFMIQKLTYKLEIDARVRPKTLLSRLERGYMGIEDI